ncbi:MAG: aspartate kinase [Bryobacteraceae bacterium]|nr:aspartate kinase [Bryobacteraceae bacterium]
MNDLLVMKFGGTSMGSADRIRAAARISADARKTRPVVVVVSAMSGVTDLLIDTLKRAEVGDREGMEAKLRALETKHVDTCCALLPPGAQQAALDAMQAAIGRFQRIAFGMLMLGERPPRSVDEGIAVGEHLSSVLMAAYLESEGVPAEAVNCEEVIVTDAVFGSASPVMDPTREKARGRLLPAVEAGRIPIATGFNGATVDGHPTTLGRGGSDFTASILAFALDASELWIWTDVDGIMTADPRLVPDAAVLDEVTYREAAELAYNGAKVLHPRTLAPLIDKQIPVWSKNSFAPEKPGTRIAALTVAAPGARAVTSMNKVALVSVDPASAAVSGARVMARALEALAGTNTEVLAFSSSSYQQSFCFLVRKEELETAVEALEAGLSLELIHGYLKPIEVDENVGLLAVVGEGMQGTPGIAGGVFNAISKQSVNIIAIAQGSSELTIAIVVRRDGLEKAVQAVHAECRMAEKVNVRPA